MADLRTTIERLREEYQSDRYAGDLSELVRKHPDRRTPVGRWLTAAAMLAASVTLAFFGSRSTPAPGNPAAAPGPQAARDNTAATGAAEVPTVLTFVIAPERARQAAIERMLVAWPSSRPAGLHPSGWSLANRPRLPNRVVRLPPRPERPRQTSGAAATQSATSRPAAANTTSVASSDQPEATASRGHLAKKRAAPSRGLARMSGGYSLSISASNRSGLTHSLRRNPHGA